MPHRTSSASRTPLAASSAGVAYVLEDFPVRSEQFLEREVRELRRLGLRLPLCLIRPPRGTTNGAELGLGTVHRPSSRLQALIDALLFRWPLCPDLLRSIPLIHQCAESERFGALGALRWYCLARFFARALCHDPPALVHAHFGFVPAMVARYLGFLLQRPWGVSLHARDIYVSPRTLAARIRGASYAVTCSRRAASDVRELVDPSVEIHVIHHGLDLARWREPEVPQERERCCLLAVGRLVPKKNFGVLIAALAELRPRFPWLRGIIVGDGPERDHLSALARELGTSVQILPWTCEADLRAHYANSLALVAPGIVTADGDRDNIPNVIVEAMAMGLPVIASASPAIEWMQADHDACLLVAPGSTSELALAIGRLLDTPGLQRALSLRARRLVERDFDLSKTAPALLGIFHSAAAAAPTRV